MAAAECIDAAEIRTCNAKILTSFKVNAKKASMQSKYIVIGNSISLDGSSETSAESAQSITSNHFSFHRGISHLPFFE